jgi:hypothetical protein
VNTVAFGCPQRGDEHQPKFSVWVWDSIWLPAVVVRPAQMDRVLVRLEHGVTFNAIVLHVRSRDPASSGCDMPVAEKIMRIETSTGWSAALIAGMYEGAAPHHANRAKQTKETAN